MSNLDCNISYFNTPRDRITVRVNIFSSLASPIKTRSKSGPNFTPLTLSTAKKLQESKLICLSSIIAEPEQHHIYPQAQKIIIC